MPYGAIPLKHGYRFIYMVAESDGEICGFIDDPNRRVVPGTNGWWRTVDPKRAAQLAEMVYGDRLIPLCRPVPDCATLPR